MKNVVFGHDMKQVDSFTIQEVGVESLVLMERAAYQTFLNIKEIYKENRPVLILCGSGNNGADGLALARMMYIEGYKVEVTALGNSAHRTGEFQTQQQTLEKLGVLFSSVNGDKIPMEKYGLIVDAIFGIGLSREIEGDYEKIIKEVNRVHDEYSIKTVAVDIPSGVDGTTGRILNVAVRADYTITFGCYKAGMLLYPGAEYCGKIVVENIGFPQMAYDTLDYQMFTYDREDLARIYPRKEYSNKGTYGKVLVIAGNRDMCGAAYFSSMAAYRMGSGIVRILTDACNKPSLSRMIPEAIITGYDSDHLTGQIVDDAISWADTIVAGPGMGVDAHTVFLLSKVLQSGKKCVIDADGLNTISKNRELLSLLHSNVVITPHLGEMARLTGMPVENIKSNLIGVATDFSKEYNVTVVLKDARTIVACRDRIYINRFGNNGMATGGSGDVLSGIIGTLVHCQKDLFEGACLGVLLHSLCGDRAKEECSEYSLLAGNLLEQIEELIRK